MKFDDHKGCGVICMLLLFVTALAIFPYYMQYEPPPSIALVLAIIPLSILFYSIFMAIFIW
ncbi:hypothetical protein CASFOL_028635 [Castilleja foliolosa]|uniref:Transmembrane protein n=1 Tax=Castilleja foliolosa TaxID=1961234 RepID=A0ABD3CEZ2_9LAMI